MREHPDLRILLADEEPSSRRERAVGHLRDCAACRAGLAATDPSRLFALLALEPLPEGLLDRLSAGVAREIAEPEALPVGRVARRGWIGIAASLLLAGAFSTYLLDRNSGPAVPQSAPVAAVAEERRAEPAFELISSRGQAETVDMTIGGERFVMIFDEGLDL